MQNLLEENEKRENEEENFKFSFRKIKKCNQEILRKN